MAAPFNTMLKSSFSEKTWVFQTLRNLQNGNPFDQDVHISVCHVPNSISAINPQAYAPQLIALGPYNYLRPELYHMERYKIETIGGCWTPEQIRLVVRKLKEIGPKVRACYHKYLDLEDDTLALMLAIDGLFLIYLLIRKHLKHFTDDATVFRDVMMLENQIPIIVLKEIGNTIGLANDEGDNDAALFSMMWAFCESQSPFEVSSDQQVLQKTKVLHLLDLLHEMITMGENIKQSDSPPQEELSQESPLELKIDHHDEHFGEDATEIVLASKAISFIKPIKLISSLPWGMISNLLSHSSGVKEVAAKNLLVEEIDIPSVTKLFKLGGIVFKPDKRGNREVQFDSMTATLYLPVITLSGNSEVILRNLEAYEIASSSSSTSGYGNLVFAQYIDLMSGIIDTKEDARLLKGAGIINGDLSNSQVADLFNGMNKSTQKVYNDAASKINAYYWKRPKVKAYRFMKKYIYASWRVLIVVFTILLLLLMILQSICDVYDCKGVIKW